MLARPLVHRLTGARGLLGGDVPVYAVYAAAEGHVALAALEPHFAQRLATALEVLPEDLTRERLATVFAGRSAAAWEQWAAERDIPLVAVVDHQPDLDRRGPHSNCTGGTGTTLRPGAVHWLP